MGSPEGLGWPGRARPRGGPSVSPSPARDGVAWRGALSSSHAPADPTPRGEAATLNRGDA
jgi:hypothetical protein